MTEGHEDYLGDLWDLLPVDPTDFIEDTPTEDEAEKTPSSEWAFDHDADVNAHHTKFTIAEHDLAARHGLAVLDPLVCSEAEAGVLIGNHAALPNVHHTKFTIAEHDLAARHGLAVLDPLVCSEAEAGVLIGNHAALPNVHHAQVHTHDGDTLQLDGVNSDGGAFSFLTTGIITFNNRLAPSVTTTVGGDVAAILGQMTVHTGWNAGYNYGFQGIGYATGTAGHAAAQIMGLAGRGYSQTSGLINWLLGVKGETYIWTAAATGAISNVAAIYADTIQKGGGATSTITNAYGIYIPTRGQGTNRYGIFQLIDQNFIQGKTTIGGVTAPNAQLRVDQDSDSAEIPVLILKQDDLSEEMIEFISTIAEGNPIEAKGIKSLTTTHFIKVTLPGALTRYFEVGTIA